MQNFRRELSFSLAGKIVKLKGSFDCLAAIQEASGVSIGQIVNQAASQNISPVVFPAIIFGGIVGAGNPDNLTFDQVKEMCFDAGLVSVMPVATKFFLLCISKNPNYTGGSEPEKNERAGSPA